MNQNEAEALRQALATARPGTEVSVDPCPGGARVIINGPQMTATSGPDTVGSAEFRVSDDGPLLRFLMRGSAVPDEHETDVVPLDAKRKS